MYNDCVRMLSIMCNELSFVCNELSFVCNELSAVCNELSFVCNELSFVCTDCVRGTAHRMNAQQRAHVGPRVRRSTCSASRMDDDNHTASDHLHSQ